MLLSSQDVAGILEDFADAALRRSRAGVRHAFDKRLAIADSPETLNSWSSARDVLARTPFHFGRRFSEKSSAANWLVVWHQTQLCQFRRHETPGGVRGRSRGCDPRARTRRCAFRRYWRCEVHLDDSRADNGPLCVLPALTHKVSARRCYASFSLRN